MKETPQGIMARIQSREKERAYCLAVLDLWVQVQAQGIKPEAVQSFGFADTLLTEAQKRQRYFRKIRLGADPYVERLPNGGERLRVYNYIRLKDGTTRQLNRKRTPPPCRGFLAAGRIWV
jgi:hypothetical protein